MAEITDLAARLHSFGAAIAEDGAAFGGILRCTTCGTERPLGDSKAVGGYYANGWPSCCGHTMRWITKRQLDEGEQS